MNIYNYSMAVSLTNCGVTFFNRNNCIFSMPNFLHCTTVEKRAQYNENVLHNELMYDSLLEA